MKIGDKIRITRPCPTGAYDVGEEALITGIAADGDNKKWCFEAYFPAQGEHWYVDDSCAEVIAQAKYN